MAQSRAPLVNGKYQTPPTLAAGTVSPHLLDATGRLMTSDTNAAAAITDGSAKTQIVDDAGNVIESTLDSAGDYHLGVAAIQSVYTDAHNSSVTPLNAGLTFTGTVTSSLGIAGIQVSLKADQNCTVYVEQSPDGNIAHWDIVDSFNYYTTKPFGITVQAVASYLRVRVTNTSNVNQTYLRLQTCLCPIVETVPRVLDPDQLLQTTVGKITGRMGRVRVSPMGALKTGATVRLVGATFAGATVDTNFWTNTTVVGTGTSDQTTNPRCLTLLTGGTANSSIVVNSTRVARYIGAIPNYYRANVNAPAVSTTKGTNTRRFGAFDANDGYFFLLVQAKGETAPTLSIVTRKATVDAPVATGSFNGDWGATYALDVNCHTFEIWWSNKNAYFFIDDVLLHTITSTVIPATTTQNLKVGMENTNSLTEDANNPLVVRSSTINRLGNLVTQPTWKYIHGAATTVLKYAAGNLHSVVVNSNTGTTITLYDGTSALGNVICLIQPNQICTLDYKGMPFYTGLYAVTVGSTIDCTIVYE